MDTMLKVYCDANIFIDYYEDRNDKLRPLGGFAFDFFSRGWNCLFKLVISGHLRRELEKHLSKEKIDEIFKCFEEKDKLIFADFTQEDITKSKRISEHWGDALHAVIAAKAGCDYLVTRNIRHYSGCEKLVKISFPESI